MNQAFLTTQSQLFFKIHNLSGQNSILDSLMVFGAESLIFLSLILVAFLATKGAVKEKKAALLILLSLGVAFLINKLIGQIFFEPRPFVSLPIKPLIFHGADNSFPSDHTTIMAVLTFSYFTYRSSYLPILIVATIWVGLSRVYVGVHYPLDILAGVLVGFFSVWLSCKVKSALLRRV